MCSSFDNSYFLNDERNRLMEYTTGISRMVPKPGALHRTGGGTRKPLGKQKKRLKNDMATIIMAVDTGESPIASVNSSFLIQIQIPSIYELTTA